MRKLFTFLLALAASVGMSWAAPAAAVNGKLPGAFSVSATKKVYFSQGNLQYNSNTQKWQFADQQYTYVGDNSGNTLITTSGIANNKGIVDLFGWVGASSSWNDKLMKYGITSSTAYGEVNGYGTSATEKLKSDWGNVPDIGSGWFTLSSEEWNYLLNSRANAANRRTFATVMGKTGLLIFPDDLLVTAKGLTVTIANYTTNKINNASTWSALEEAGVVFLPAAGRRAGLHPDYVGTQGQYWTSSPYTSSSSWALFVMFAPSYDRVYYNAFDSRATGRSVRLVSTTPVQYTITFKNYNGTTLQSSKVNHNTIPSYTGTTPTRPTDAAYVYTFSSWSPTIAKATGNATYTAQFSQAPNQATVNDVIAKINAIGEVAYTPECKDKIDLARNAYNALTDEQKALVSNYATLEAAEARYAYLTPVEITPNEDPKNEGTYYSTYYDGNRLFLLPADVEAYVAYVQGDALMMQLIAESGDILPKATAVILRSTVTPFTLLPQDEGAVDMSEVENALQGSDIIAPAPANCYVLSGTNEYGVGFYQINSTSLKAHKAYVIYSGSAAPKRMRFVFNQEQTATGMENVQSDKVQCTKVIKNGQLFILKNGVKYNAQGQKIEN